MSIHTPPADWLKPPKGAERFWVGLALLWCLVMFVAMHYWYFYGKQNSTGESYRVEPMAFAQRVARFIETNKVGDQNGIPVVEATPGGDAYLQAQMWSWFPCPGSGCSPRSSLARASSQSPSCRSPTTCG